MIRDETRLEAEHKKIYDKLTSLNYEAISELYGSNIEDCTIEQKVQIISEVDGHIKSMQQKLLEIAEPYEKEDKKLSKLLPDTSDMDERNKIFIAREANYRNIIRYIETVIKAFENKYLKSNYISDFHGDLSGDILRHQLKYNNIIYYIK